MNQKENVTLLCNRSHSRVEIPAAGFLTLPAHCTLMTNLFSIEAYPQEKSITEKSGITKFVVQEIKRPVMTEFEFGLAKIADIKALKLEILNHMEHLNKLREAHKAFQQQLKGNVTELGHSIDIAHYQLYGAFSGVGFIFLIFIIGAIWLSCYLAKKFKNTIKP